MNDQIATPIQGLTITLRKVVGDPRGMVAEMIPGGTENPDAAVGIKHIYASIGTGKHISRAGHYHDRKVEFFYALTGTVLWAFQDLRKDSPTFGKTYGVVVGWSPCNVPGPQYVLEQNQMAQMLVPTGVYHVYWPLTDEKVVNICIASTVHDEDYVRMKPEELPEMVTLARAYGISL